MFLLTGLRLSAAAQLAVEKKTKSFLDFITSHRLELQPVNNRPHQLQILMSKRHGARSQSSLFTPGGGGGLTSPRQPVNEYKHLQ